MNVVYQNTKLVDYFNKRVFEIQNGFPCGTWNQEGTGVIHLRPFNINGNGFIDFSDIKYAETEKDLTQFFLRSHDVVFNNTNSEDLVGKTALWLRSDRAVLSNHMTFIRIKNNEVLNPAFLSFFLYKKWTDGYFKSICRRHVNQASISKDRLLDTEIPFFDIVEQRKIAYILSNVQRAIEKQETIISATTELKRALLQKLFTEGLNGEQQKETEIGLVPESWQVVRLDNVATIERGKFSHRPRNAPQFYGGDIPFVQTGDVSNCGGRIKSYSQTLNDAGLAISKLFKAGTILITIAANIGFSGILEFDSACPDSLIGLTGNDRVLSEYLQYYLSTQQPRMDQLAPKGIQKNINIQFLKPWPIPLPSLKEQDGIVNILSITDSKIDIARRKKDSLYNLFSSMLHQLMTAQIRVDEIDFDSLDLVS